MQAHWFRYNPLKGLYDIDWNSLRRLLIESHRAAYLSANDPPGRESDPDNERDENL
jgi:hypothetical protein